MRAGIGFDVHRFVEGRELVLGGVRIPYPFGLEGWSDADVLVHAIADALLGAAGMGDIGAHFPAGDAEFKDISSMMLLERVVTALYARGYEIINVDSVLILEEPNITIYKDTMRSYIAKVLGVKKANVSVKATTTEGLGFTGRGEGVAAQAVAMIKEQGVEK